MKIMKQEKIQDINFLIKILENQLHVSSTQEINETYDYLLNMKNQLEVH